MSSLEFYGFSFCFQERPIWQWKNRLLICIWWLFGRS